MTKVCPAGSEAATRLIKEKVREIRTQIPLVQREDMDGIHDMRVASRRLRAVLGEHQPYIKTKRLEAFEAKVRGITKLLGVPRELDVSIDLLENHRTKVIGPPKFALDHAIAYLREERRQCAERCAKTVEAVESPAFDKALMNVFESTRPREACYVEEAPRQLEKRFAKLSKAHSRWRKHGELELLHEVRIAFKKLRYTCEVYEPLYGKPMKQYIKQLKKAQEHLGEWNDYRVAVLLIQQSEPAADAKARLGLPVLYDQLLQLETDLRKAFDRDADAFFSDENAEQARTLFRHPQMTCCQTNGQV